MSLRRDSFPPEGVPQRRSAHEEKCPSKTYFMIVPAATKIVERVENATMENARIPRAQRESIMRLEKCSQYCW